MAIVVEKPEDFKKEISFDKAMDAILKKESRKKVLAPSTKRQDMINRNSRTPSSCTKYKRGGK